MASDMKPPIYKNGWPHQFEHKGVILRIKTFKGKHVGDLTKAEIAEARNFFNASDALDSETTDVG